MAEPTETCAGCSNALVGFVLLTEDQKRLEQYLTHHNMLKGSVACPTCGREAVKSPDGFWRCQKKTKGKRVVKCNTKIAMTRDSVFENCNLPMKQIIMFFYLYLSQPPPRSAILMEQVNISRKTYVNWASFCREVCIYWAEATATMLGGPGKIVEIDEAKFGNRKYHRGRIIKGNWVFGGVERDSKNCFYATVPARDAATLTAVINKWILPGTCIISDCWKAYDRLHEHGYTHMTVNHSKNFVDPETGAHTQNIERSWRDARGEIPRFGRRAEYFDGYLAEFQFKRAYSRIRDRMHMFLCYAGKLNPGLPALANC